VIIRTDNAILPRYEMASKNNDEYKHFSVKDAYCKFAILRWKPALKRNSITVQKQVVNAHWSAQNRNKKIAAEMRWREIAKNKKFRQKVLKSDIVLVWF
jgi:hypothetical protein